MRKVSVLATSIALLGSIVYSQASVASSCSTKTLKGTYIYTSQGFSAGAPVADSGKEIYDGKGNITTVYTDGTGKVLTTTGTYTVNSQCVGKSSYADGSAYTLFVSPTGDSLAWNLTSATPGTAQSAIENRVSLDSTP